MSTRFFIMLALPLVALSGCWCKKRSCCTHDHSEQASEVVTPAERRMTTERVSGPMQEAEQGTNWADEEETDK